MINSVHILRVGSCMAASRPAGMNGWGRTAFPSICALIRHDKLGSIIFDTGYAPRVFDATRALPERLYRTLMPITLPEQETLTAQFANLGVNIADVGTVILSHLHVDHVGGLLDFPNAGIIAGNRPKNLNTNGLFSRFAQTASACLPALIPHDYDHRLRHFASFPEVQLPKWMSPFRTGRDLAGGGDIIAVPLPGHSHDHHGILLPETDKGPLFLVGDACWSLPACKAGRLPSVLASFICHDWKQYKKTFAALGTLVLNNRGISIIPSHCAETFRGLT